MVFLWQLLWKKPTTKIDLFSETGWNIKSLPIKYKGRQKNLVKKLWFARNWSFEISAFSSFSLSFNSPGVAEALLTRWRCVNWNFDSQIRAGKYDQILYNKAELTRLRTPSNSTVALRNSDLTELFGVTIIIASVALSNNICWPKGTASNKANMAKSEKNVLNIGVTSSTICAIKKDHVELIENAPRNFNLKILKSREQPYQ